MNSSTRSIRVIGILICTACLIVFLPYARDQRSEGLEGNGSSIGSADQIAFRLQTARRNAAFPLPGQAIDIPANDSSIPAIDVTRLPLYAWQTPAFSDQDLFAIAKPPMKPLWPRYDRRSLTWIFIVEIDSTASDEQREANGAFSLLANTAIREVLMLPPQGKFNAILFTANDDILIPLFKGGTEAATFKHKEAFLQWFTPLNIEREKSRLKSTTHLNSPQTDEFQTSSEYHPSSLMIAIHAALEFQPDIITVITGSLDLGTAGQTHANAHDALVYITDAKKQLHSTKRTALNALIVDSADARSKTSLHEFVTVIRSLSGYIKSIKPTNHAD